MKPDLELNLKGLFPDIIPLNLYFQCNDGWYELIRTLCFQITQEIAGTQLKFQVAQVKEKFGGLRFYYSWDSEPFDDSTSANLKFYTVNGMVHFAESFSYKICEICGNSGKLRQVNGWMTTQCDSCYNESVKSIKKEDK